MEDIALESSRMLQRIQVIDSHTGGEPTRLVLGGGPDFNQLLEQCRADSSTETLQKIVAHLQRDYDHLRRGIICEPRSSEHWVGAWLVPPVDSNHLCGVIFFNNVGYLGMCGHGTMGLMASLAYLDRVQPGTYRIETPVGMIETELLDANHTRIANVPSYLYRHKVQVPLTNGRVIVGDLAWGGNWFFLSDDHPYDLTMVNIPELTRFTLEIQAGMERMGITGPQGERIDHVELFVAGWDGADSRNFVLCPGGAYDRSPCGTGTSAKVACLAAEGKLQPGQVWVQESITGSRFQARYQLQEPPTQATDVTYPVDTCVIRPEVTGSAFVSGETTLVFDSQDDFRDGIPA